MGSRRDLRFDADQICKGKCELAPLSGSMPAQLIDHFVGKWRAAERAPRCKRCWLKLMRRRQPSERTAMGPENLEIDVQQRPRRAGGTGVFSKKVSEEANGESDERLQER